MATSPLRRHDGRKADQLRPVRFQRNFVPSAGGSVLVSFGSTRVICTAMFETGVPSWRKGSGEGWVSAEYGMLPGSTPQRKKRDSGKPDGRSVEIQRLVGRALRSVVDTKLLGENCVWLDCDVLQADGGTRTASITGAYVALYDCLRQAVKAKKIAQMPITNQIAAISVGMVNGQAVLDLDYVEDVAAQVDMNVAMLAGDKFVELQGTAEHGAFTKSEFLQMLERAEKGIRELHSLQNKALRLK
ncbi:MAG: ribonuclease PH [Phycisphaerae bacterium]|jgi:ribonuclease PH